MRPLRWVKNSWVKIIAVGWRIVLFEAFNHVYNYPLYMWAMHSLGIVWGWLTMASISLIINAGFFYRYDRDGVDWLFANAARDWEEGTKESSSRFRRMIVKISKFRDNKGFGGIMTFILASINIDPVIVAVHYRKAHFNGLNKKDWMLLVASTAVANLWWGARIGLIVKILEWLVKRF